MIHTQSIIISIMVMDSIVTIKILDIIISIMIMDIIFTIKILDIIISIMIVNVISMSITITNAIMMMANMRKNILTQVKNTFLGLGAILQLSKTSSLHHSGGNHSKGWW